MPEGRSLCGRTAVRCRLFVLDRTAVSASSSSPGGSVKVFIDAQGGLFDRIAVRCQLLFLWRVRKGIRRCQREGLVTVCTGK
jgi:hypothetical protein